MHLRHLKDLEIREAKKVFRDTVPYGKVRISNVLGAGGAPYTIPIPGLLGFFSPSEYWINAGSKGYTSMLSADLKSTLIHELTHVWQGHHSHWSAFYLLDSLAHQGAAIVTTGDRDNAYRYKPGADWGSYSTEQQAKIVEDWYVDGMRTSSPLYRYIINAILGGPPCVWRWCWRWYWARGGGPRRSYALIALVLGTQEMVKELVV